MIEKEMDVTNIGPVVVRMGDEWNFLSCPVVVFDIRGLQLLGPACCYVVPLQLNL
jgi:hypothetical protein